MLKQSVHAFVNSGGSLKSRNGCTGRESLSGRCVNQFSWAATGLGTQAPLSRHFLPFGEGQEGWGGGGGGGGLGGYLFHITEEETMS